MKNAFSKQNKKWMLLVRKADVTLNIACAFFFLGSHLTWLVDNDISPSWLACILISGRLWATDLIIWMYRKEWNEQSYWMTHLKFTTLIWIFFPPRFDISSKWLYCDQRLSENCFLTRESFWHSRLLKTGWLSLINTKKRKACEMGYMVTLTYKKILEAFSYFCVVFEFLFMTIL